MKAMDQSGDESNRSKI